MSKFGIILEKKQLLFMYPCDLVDLKMCVHKNYRNEVICDLNSVSQKMITLD